MMKALALGAAALALAGCVTDGVRSPAAPPSAAQIPAGQAKLKMTADAYPSPDITVLFYTPGRGFSVEYLSPGGKSYVWPPGAAKVAEGAWLSEAGGPALVRPGAIIALRQDPYALKDREDGRAPFVYGACDIPPLFAFEGMREMADDCNARLIR